MKRRFPKVRVSKEAGDFLTKAEGEVFPWGRVVAIHDIGEYRIIEYLERKVDGHTVTMELTDEHSFHIDGASCSCPTLDAALVTAIGYKHEGPNGRAAYYFMKMIAEG